VAVVVKFRRRLTRLVERASFGLPPRVKHIVVARWHDLTRGLSVLLNPSIGFPAAGASAIVWTLTVILQWLVLRSFQPRAGAADAAFMVAAVSLASALPAAPGFIGVYHWAGQQALISAFPDLYDPSTALAAATVAHALSYVTSTALGVAGLWYFGMPPSAMSSALRERHRVHARVEGVN
jgi:uncharacterized membrane protein YbhN (UPF0104 family)